MDKHEDLVRKIGEQIQQNYNFLTPKEAAQEAVKWMEQAIRDYEKSLPYSEFRRDVNMFLTENGYIQKEGENNG